MGGLRMGNRWKGYSREKAEGLRMGKEGRVKGGKRGKD